MNFISKNSKQSHLLQLFHIAAQKTLSCQIGNSHLLASFCLLSMSVSIFLFLFTLPNFGTYVSTNTIGYGLILVGSLASLYTLRVSQSVRLASCIYLSCHLAGLTLFSFTEKVPISGTFIWFSGLGVLGIYLFDWKLCKYWLLAVGCCQIVLLQLFRQTSSLIPAGISQHDFINIFRGDVVMSTLSLWTIVIIYEKRRHIALEKLAKAQAELSLHKEQAMQGARLNELIQMAGGVAHEINNPLAIIHGYTRILKKEFEQHSGLVKNLEPIFAKIESSCERISQVSRSLLTYAQESESEQVNRFNLEKLKNEAISLCQEKLTHRNISLRNIVPSSDTEISAAYLKILQILVNLLNNSIDAVEGGTNKWIELKLSIHEGELTLTVTDSGPGIDSELKNRIHAPFFTTKPIGKGSGLGLSIVDGLVRELKGRTFLDGEASHTCFVVVLPIDPNPKGLS